VSGSPPLIARVQFDHTLMRLDGALGIHVPEPPLPKVWFLEIPTEWDSGTRVAQALQAIFAVENARLRANEPSDPNYLTALDSRHTTVQPPPEGPFPWETEARIVWESSNCWGSLAPNAGTPWRAIPPGDFTALYLLRGLHHGRIDRERFMRLMAGELFRLTPDVAGKMADRPIDFIEMQLRLGRMV
jgi:hypothetical protein